MPQLIPVLRALYTHYHSRGEHRVAHELAGQLVSLAQQSGDPAAQLIAYSALGQELVQLGGFVAGREALERALACYDPEQYRGRVHLSIDEPGAAALAYLGVALVFLGYPDQALVRFRTALTIDETLAHPAQLGGVLYGISLLHVIRREGREAQALAEKGIAHCDEKNIPLWRDVLRINRAHALALQGCSREGLAEGMRALAAYRALPTRLFLPFLLTQVAEMHHLAGQVEAGLAVVAEGFASVDDTGEHKVDAELHRLRAELLARQGGAAEADLQRALEVARKQQARWWELRATMSLCRLWREQGKREQARQALAGIYGWFTEGFDTPDLLAAKALLDELTGGTS
jgi:tetratricopeptide (TPR) repeat protein